ncbi:unnamed protein product [Orchesella dallaii]|uniref:Tudor domain-containing protein n=1 Tax=Orchesella dallaii TaxID=48710 RepID=A0ABP1R851_9HEXA
MVDEVGLSIYGGRIRGRGRGKPMPTLPGAGSFDTPDGCSTGRLGSPVQTLQQQIKMGFSAVQEVKHAAYGSFLNNVGIGSSELSTFQKVPDRLINQHRKIPAALYLVDVENKEAWICFFDPETNNQRDLLVEGMQTFCESPEAVQYLVRPDEVSKDEVVIVKDNRFNYRRTRIPNGRETDIGKLVDLDGRVAGMKFQGISDKIYRIPAGMKQLRIWFQAVKCKVALSTSSSADRWLQHNDFIFRNQKWVETCLLAALECSRAPFNFHVSNMQEGEPDGELTVFIDIFQTEKLTNDFLVSLKFCTIPRTPSVGQEKLAVITNLRAKGQIDVVMYDNVWLTLREILKKLFSEQEKLRPKNGLDLAVFFKELIEGFEVRCFLAALPGETTQLHRVQVIGIEFRKHAKVLFIDIGKEMTIPLESLMLPFEGCTNEHVPQILELICPQAVTLELKGFNSEDGNDEGMLLNLRLECKPCFVKIVDSEGPNGHPIAVVRTDITPSEVTSIMDYVHSLGNLSDFGSNGIEEANVSQLNCLKGIAKKLSS